VALVGSGPAGFYTLQALLAAPGLHARIDMFDRLPTPFGLVRHGVAPDHQKIKSVTAVYHKLALHTSFRFYGGVEFGRDLDLADLMAHYHQIVFTTGAQTDRRLGIPGEELRGSHPATEFVAWYNGHPDYCDLKFALDCEQAVIVGVGNVAVDVARILCRTPAELEATDIAEPALAALRDSRVRTVHLLGRRGPAQAAFTSPEVKELGELQDTETSTIAEEVELDSLSRAQMQASPDKATTRKVEILQSYAGRREPGKSRRLLLRFLVSPVEILGDPDGRVRAVRIVQNELVAGSDGSVRARPTGREELIPAGLVFRSVGYQGVALPGLPFDAGRGVIPNERGRILDGSGQPMRGLYVGGWIKRGPVGVIGTNKTDASETVRSMLEDLERGLLLQPIEPELEGPERRLQARDVRCVSYADWQRLDAQEVERGRPCGRPRVKFSRYEEFDAALGRERR
jgi:ferredoxin--NADP+ reductase